MINQKTSYKEDLALKLQYYAEFLNKNSLLIAGACLFGYHLLFLIAWKDSYFQVHDGNDLTGFLHALGRPEVGWRLNSTVDQVMNGLPRGLFQFGFDLVLVFSTLFTDVFYVYLVNSLLVHTFAFVGMYIFLRRLGKIYNFPLWVCAFTALNFALIPFLNWKGISIAGLPLLLWAFWSIADRQSLRWAFAIVIFFPFYSSLVHIGVFVCICAGAAVVVVSWRKKTIDWLLVLAAFILGVGYLVSAFPMLYTYVWLSPVVHRSEWGIPPLSFIGTFWTNFSRGHFNSGSLHFPTLIFLVIILPFVALGGYKQQLWRLLKWLLIAVSVSLIVATYEAQLLNEINQQLNFSNFNWSRFHYFRAFIWGVIFALCLQSVAIMVGASKFTSLRLLPVFLILCQTSFTLRNNFEFLYTTYNLVQKVQDQPLHVHSYANFFAEELYEEVRDYIGQPQEDYRIVSLGLHPAIAQHNGFYTLDSYQNLFPLDYKHAFRQIIAPELEKSPYRKIHFDKWGNRVYLVSSELPNNNDAFLIDKYQPITLKNWSIDTAAFEEIGGEYIFSAVLIENADTLGLELLNIFERDDASWRIHLYSVRDN